MLDSQLRSRWESIWLTSQIAWKNVKTFAFRLLLVSTDNHCFQLANLSLFYSYRWVELVSEGLRVDHNRSTRKESRISERRCTIETPLCRLLCWKLPVLCLEYQCQEWELFQVHHADWCAGSWLHSHCHQETPQTRRIVSTESTGQHLAAEKWIEHADRQRRRSQGRESKDQITRRHLQRHLQHCHDDLNLLADHLLEEFLQIQEDHLN